METETKDMLQKETRYLAAALQGILGWEWLVSGVNKVASGTFPSGLAATLSDGVKSNPNGWYVAFLRTVVLPHSVAFGYLIEVVEVLAGLALLAGALVLLGGIRRRGEPQYRLAVAQVTAAAVASLACIALCVNFHFFMGDGVLPGVSAANAFSEGVDLDTLMPPLALVILVFNLYALRLMTGVSVATITRRVRHIARMLLTHVPARNMAIRAP
ncbi:MAG TPA: hypothetical protein VJN88_11080 [Ktedonobacterales bacterium]|nr:hypothetical protein [Ktedonobacterales bacterium]